jgi:Ca2+-binding EF-hand superfamily protein
MDNGIYN